jgi:transcriptional regulator with XRE-family HTH domain
MGQTNGLNRLRAEREARGWSQDFLAEMIGMHRPRIHDWETSKRFPDHRSVLRLSSAFDVSFARIYDWLDTPYEAPRAKAQ